MREILFRGKRIDNGNWVEGFYVEDPFCDRYEICDVNSVTYHREDVYPSTVGQYTGLQDKNGKRIFEGDIVRYRYETGKGHWNSDQLSVIEWENTGCFMRGIMGTNKYACATGWLVSIPHGNGKFFEVIGNIHDNPELLEVNHEN